MFAVNHFLDFNAKLTVPTGCRRYLEYFTKVCWSIKLLIYSFLTNQTKMSVYSTAGA